MRDFSSPSQEGSPSLTQSSQDCDLAEITNGFTHGGPLDISFPQSPDLVSKFQKTSFAVEMNFSSENVVPAERTNSSEPDRKHSLPEPVVSNHASNWSSQDDAILLNARSRGHGWSQIQREHFRNKTANACRKRHERLIAKRRGLEWNQDMLEKLSTEYIKLREQIWQPLAHNVGEKWQDVEKACFEKGLKSLTTPSRSHNKKDITHKQIQPGEISKSQKDVYPRRASVLPLKDILD